MAPTPIDRTDEPLWGPQRDAVGEVLAVAQLLGRLDVRRARLWLCDCLRRAEGQVFAGERHGDASLRTVVSSLRRGVELGDDAAFEYATAILVVLIDRIEDRPKFVAEVVLDAVDELRGPESPGPTLARELESLAASVRQVMIDPHDAQPWLARDMEQRWQVRRLLWRLDLMPRGGDIEVRLDLADHAGILPTAAKPRARFEALRVRQLTDRDARVELIVEFPELVFHAELERG